MYDGWIMIEEKRIKKFNDLRDTWPVYRCNFDEVDKGIRERAIKGGEEIRNKKGARDIRFNDTKNGRGVHETKGGIHIEVFNHWIREFRPHLPHFEPDYKPKFGKALAFSLDLAAIRGKTCKPDRDCPTGEEVSWSWWVTDKRDRVGPSWVIDIDELTDEGSLYIPDDAISVFGITCMSGWSEIWGWCTYKDIRELDRLGLLTDPYDDDLKGRKVGIFLIDLMEQGMLRPIHDLTDDKILNPMVIAAAQKAVEDEEIDPQWHKE